MSDTERLEAAARTLERRAEPRPAAAAREDRAVAALLRANHRLFRHHPAALIERAAQFDHDTKQPLGFAAARRLPASPNGATDAH